MSDQEPNYNSVWDLHGNPINKAEPDKGPVCVCDICGQNHAEIKHCAFKGLIDDLKKELAEAKEQNQSFANVLAVIHRDGGHYITKHGHKKASIDAIKILEDRRNGLAEARAEMSGRCTTTKVCHWIQDEDYGVYETSCGHKFQTLDGIAKENNFAYCTFCGGVLIDVSHPEPLPDGVKEKKQ